MRELFRQLVVHLESISADIKKLSSGVDDAKKPDDDTQKVQPPIVVNSELKLPVAITEAYHAEQTDRVKSESERKRREHHYLIRGYIRTGVEILGLIGIAFTVYFTMAQWREMRQQSIAMEKTLRQVAAQTGLSEMNATGAIESARAAREAVEEARISREMSKKALDETLRENRQSLKATLAQGQDALDASIKASHLDNRPWLTLTSFILTEEPKADINVSMRGELINSGKSPAIKIVPQSFLMISEKPLPMTRFRFPAEVLSRSTLAPNQPNFTFNVFPRRFDATQIASYVNKKSLLYIHAIVRYQDVFSVPHWTMVCAYRGYGDSLTQVSFCEGNDIDQNEKPNDPIGPPGSDFSMPDYWQRPRIWLPKPKPKPTLK